mmetsp:Transcript_13036/g.35999  ORF Transcript_13036/g.35999 Transcript_13036/m.35999 type:complete len:147 (-) Transcript_13036:376-816(-)
MSVHQRELHPGKRLCLSPKRQSETLPDVKKLIQMRLLSNCRKRLLETLFKQELCQEPVRACVTSVSRNHPQTGNTSKSELAACESQAQGNTPQTRNGRNAQTQDSHTSHLGSETHFDSHKVLSESRFAREPAVHTRRTPERGERKE